MIKIIIGILIGIGVLGGGGYLFVNSMFGKIFKKVI